LSLEVVISDASGTRVLGEQDLPLNIGTAPDAVIRIPGPMAAGYLAQVGVLDGRAFFQASGRGDVKVNDEVVASTRWLDPDDSLLVGGVAIRCNIADGRLAISVDYHEVDYATAPPVIEEQETPDVITPLRVRSKSVAVAATEKKRRINPVYAGLVLLVGAALYMFAAVTVVIDADQPNVEISLPGSWLTPGGDGRYLLWRGTYQVEMAASGCYAYEAQVVVIAGEGGEY